MGKYLVRSCGGQEHGSYVTEVEVYEGFDDMASHAYRGETNRNAPMFGSAGFWYVYLVYGIHFMLNIVTERKGYPSAVLIRGVEEISGPGRLTKYFHINKEQNVKLAEKGSGLWVEDRGLEIRKESIGRLPRVGISYAGEKWARKPYRLLYNKNKQKE